MSDLEVKTSSANANVFSVVETIPADLLTPLAVYLKLTAEGGESFLLESVEGGESLARYSFIGVDPYLVASGNNMHVTVKGVDGERKIEIPMIEYLRDHFLIICHCLPSMISGSAFGTFPD